MVSKALAHTLGRMEELISDVNTKNIANHIKFDSLDSWCLEWQMRAYTNLAFIKSDLKATELTAALKGE